MKNLAGLMKQAQQMQQNMQEMQSRLEAMDIRGEAGAGLVRVTLSGKGEMKGIEIDPKLIDPSDAEMLQDLILAAHRDAKSRLEAVAAEEMQKVTGGISLPPGMKLPF
ncbi:MAG: YbaB/EbfC family nucleoid-associated protein [Acidiphilium sp. 37-67-22]|jgi:DNA-binding YbaB/EbfC family protein|uniref:YbaB/EbfC family nucleoid-associated protein n=1 Tax=unclassified Acidiphilium TaxID=2617493 RepID=UPI000BC785E6|nr:MULTISPECIES: YbaB/EbfC family nucleoid-associated protein [unclassified Acidiphilium]OYW11125.1 MAG: YbaB/EbfC family nucleoid-associated protein [Acidiphilium sp. 37-67-22]OYV55382.1 MAG: YbaB/EbfC family nucleoid-associated protein [Acidiphilium sp. 20-67-58]HQT61882.1 YbaB/EbfC family nucleoid-associated protein [Acidiphilium sp.]HQT73138.1 YbaB/EbfC family nucleoid-associated protein [Acidiphilium sp.]HQU11983.1 YbaB/EbfC family nucleoid-associated protein [Acidiphilium sp.]